LRQAKKSEKETLQESDRQTTQISGLLKEVEQINQTKKELYSEMRQLKYRESKHLQEYGELEEENINLQKQVPLNSLVTRKFWIWSEKSKISLKKLVARNFIFRIYLAVPMFLPPKKERK
jgi:hypothetical protein